MIFDGRQSVLGEGPIWHPLRKQLFWFDILERKLITQSQSWVFDRYVSAAGWIDERSLLIASETDLFVFDLTTSKSTSIFPFEADNPITRSNDGRADPWGGFWIGTMGKNAEPAVGGIYRLFDGELRQLHDKITISNAICFSPDRKYAYFTDTPTRKIMRQELSADDGWPCGAPKVWLDLTDRHWFPDGAVTDSDGNFWLAKWGGSGVACFDTDAVLIKEYEVPAHQVTCPAFGGATLQDMFLTSACVDLEPDVPTDDGATFVLREVGQGRAEPQVLI